MQGQLKTFRTGTQCANILDYLQEGNSLTAMECLQKGWGMNLKSRIHDLREAGYKIKSEKVNIPNGYIARYSIEDVNE